MLFCFRFGPSQKHTALGFGSIIQAKSFCGGTAPAKVLEGLVGFSAFVIGNDWYVFGRFCSFLWDCKEQRVLPTGVIKRLKPGFLLGLVLRRGRPP